jgi:RNA polymerase sigma-70 factor, ECF subfamily
MLTAVDETAELLARVRRRDPEAWEVLYVRSYRPLLAYAVRRLGDRYAAEEVVSEVMTRAVDAIDRFVPGPAGIEPWLFAIARNVVREHWRRRARDRDLPARLLLDPDDDGPVEIVVGREERSTLLAAFAELDAEDQELLELRVVAGLSAEAVGEVQGRSAGAVRMAQSRALGRLRRTLGRQDRSAHDAL